MTDTQPTIPAATPIAPHAFVDGDHVKNRLTGRTGVVVGPSHEPNDHGWLLVKLDAPEPAIEPGGPELTETNETPGELELYAPPAASETPAAKPTPPPPIVRGLRHPDGTLYRAPPVIKPGPHTKRRPAQHR